MRIGSKLQKDCQPGSRQDPEQSKRRRSPRVLDRSCDHAASGAFGWVLVCPASLGGKLRLRKSQLPAQPSRNRQRRAGLYSSARRRGGQWPNIIRARAETSIRRQPKEKARAGSTRILSSIRPPTLRTDTRAKAGPERMRAVRHRREKPDPNSRTGSAADCVLQVNVLIRLVCGPSGMRRAQGRRAFCPVPFLFLWEHTPADYCSTSSNA